MVELVTFGPVSPPSPGRRVSNELARHKDRFASYMKSRDTGNILAVVRKMDVGSIETMYRHREDTLRNTCHYHDNEPWDCPNLKDLETCTHQWIGINNGRHGQWSFEVNYFLADQFAQMEAKRFELYDHHIEQFISHWRSILLTAANSELAVAQALDLPVRLLIIPHPNPVCENRMTLSFQHNIKYVTQIQLPSDLKKDFEEELVVHKLTCSTLGSNGI